MCDKHLSPFYAIQEDLVPPGCMEPGGAKPMLILLANIMY
jgi:hypothetical protein